jgi:hypothetical protein
VRPLDTRIATALLNVDQNAQRAVARGESGILAALRGDRADMIVIDEATHDTVVAVAGRQVHVFRQGGKAELGVVDAAEIQSAFSRGSRVRLLGYKVVVTFQDPRMAARFEGFMNKRILACRPRTIPILYPQFFLDLIAASEVPATLTNTFRLIERIVFQIGVQGAIFCAQIEDPSAFEEFVRLFADNGTADHRQLNVPDNMIDWLWKWNPSCHKSLEGSVHGWRTELPKPGTFLKRGHDIQPWFEDPNNTSHERTWRLVYETNQGNNPPV